jgi:C1A family cysteine protease
MNTINDAVLEATGGRALGWLRELPDIRDITPDHERVSGLLAETYRAGLNNPDARGAAAFAPAKTPPAVAVAAAAGATVDLRKWCSPIEDQGELGSCTANAGVALVEYFERRAFGRHLDGSRLFVYKATRNLMHVTGDTGAYLRTTMKALACFGTPPEDYWPYKITQFDVEPAAFLYAFASDFKAITYYRLDPPGTTPANVLANIKSNLSAGLPSMFGFTVYHSIGQAATTGKIPFPSAGESVLGGHAIAAVGFDDAITITNSDNGSTTVGALLIRNSWGTSWGDRGYGWLPYEYVLRRVAVDWWSLIKADWINTGAFGTA